MKKPDIKCIDSQCSSKEAFFISGEKKIWNILYINAACWKIQEDPKWWKTSSLASPKCFFSEMLCFYLYEEKVNCGGMGQRITTQANSAFNNTPALLHSSPALSSWIFVLQESEQACLYNAAGFPLRFVCVRSCWGPVTPQEPCACRTTVSSNMTTGSTIWVTGSETTSAARRKSLYCPLVDTCRSYCFVWCLSQFITKPMYNSQT